MDDHLYPALPGMLVLVDFEWYTNAMSASDLRLDLRDVTARAHAAMVYTRVNANADIFYTCPECPACGGYGIVSSDSSDNGLAPCPDCGGGNHPQSLCRMRALDDSVTPAEARAALDWAAEVNR